MSKTTGRRKTKSVPAVRRQKAVGRRTRIEVAGTGAPVSAVGARYQATVPDTLDLGCQGHT